MVGHACLVVASCARQANCAPAQRLGRRVFKRHFRPGDDIWFGEIGETDGAQSVARVEKPLAQKPVPTGRAGCFCIAIATPGG